MVWLVQFIMSDMNVWIMSMDPIVEMFQSGPMWDWSIEHSTVANETRLKWLFLIVSAEFSSLNDSAAQCFKIYSHIFIYVG